MTTTMTLSRCPVTDHKRAVSGETVSRPYCRWGQDYPCGCVYCSDAAYNAACKQAAEWNAATATHRAWVVSITSALAVLANVGRAIALVASMPGAIRAFALGAVSVYHQVPSKGARYRIVGKRGNAKKVFGVTGVCKWIGEADYQGRSTGAYRVGLAVEGEPKLVYVAFGQVERLPESQEEIQAKIERQIVQAAITTPGVRPRWTGKLPARRSKKTPAPVAYVVSGRDRGASGTVFWLGADKRTGEADARLGIRCANGATVWASAYDCRNEAPVDSVPLPADERVLIERIAADAVMADKPELARELLAQVH